MKKKSEAWKKSCLGPDATVRDAIQLLDQTSFQIVLVLNAEGKLLGTVTDGDVRRGVLKGIALSSPIDQIQYTNPTTVPECTARSQIFSIFKEKILKRIPVLDRLGVVVGVECLEDYLAAESIENPVVIMAGGLGKRLYPLTKDTPKPMLKVGEKPILEMIVESFVAQGFRKFFLSVNYKADQVENHFGDGLKWGVQIDYLRETTQLGTAGSLTLLSEVAQASSLPIVVMNGDLLTHMNFARLLEFHASNQVKATLCVREYDFQVPYGVVTMDATSGQVSSLDEKPTHNFFINGGIYVLEPEVLDLIPPGVRYDMTELFSKLLEQSQPVGAFPVRELWMDIGRLDEFERVSSDPGLFIKENKIQGSHK